MKTNNLAVAVMAILFMALVSCGGKDQEASKSPDTIRVDSNSVSSDSIVNPNEIDKEEDENEDAEKVEDMNTVPQDN